jgi:single-stranded DNA-binding protein
MKNLNSILIEGVIQSDPLLDSPVDKDAIPSCSFSLGSEPEAPSVPVVVHSRLAVYCSKNLYRGSSVRVVGHIAQDAEASAASGTFQLYVVAEHIEVKPSYSKVDSEETANAF